MSWIARYEDAWRAPGTGLLPELFTDEVFYLPSPWAKGVSGIGALASYWEEEREGPDEQFTIMYELVAVDGSTAVARIIVEYETDRSWRDLWVLQFESDGRCSRFEEWPFTPGQDDGH